jgi:hypothetical protein
MRTVCGALVLSALAMFPGRASAEPIPWTYHNQFGALSGGSTLLLFNESLGWDTGQAHAFPDSGGENNNSRIGVGYVFIGNAFLSPGSPPASADVNYKAIFTLTDTASGQSETVSLTGLSLYFVFGQRSKTVEQTLGVNTYIITLKEERQTQAIVVVASVNVVTPEPGSLILGALALMPVGMRVVRRRVGAIR